MLFKYNFYYIIILTLKIWTGSNTIMGVEKMTNEDFQRLVIEKLGNLEKGQHDLEMSVKSLEISVKGLELSMKDLEQGQSEIKEDIKAIVEQTADLTEFREEVKDKLDTLIQENLSIHGILGEHEVAIRTIRRRVI